jgi:hypothetical protein
MNDLRLSTKELIATAKADMPSAAARAKMWAGVSGVVGGAAAASGATASAFLGGGATATKILTIGALFGGTLTVGLATVLLQVGPVRVPPTRAPILATMAQSAPVALAGSPGHESISAPRLDPPSTLNTPPIPAANAASTVGPATHKAPAAHSALRHAKSGAHEDSLAREAALVAEARSALGRGDPRSALRAIRAARAIPSRQLVPEELAVEELALRALGQSDEANGIDVMLRLQYPEAALAR